MAGGGGVDAGAGGQGGRAPLGIRHRTQLVPARARRAADEKSRGSAGAWRERGARETERGTDRDGDGDGDRNREAGRHTDRETGTETDRGVGRSARIIPPPTHPLG